jgi:hypothetical protein
VTDTMTERREFGFLWRRGRFWWLRYRVGGHEHRESSHSTSRREAEKLLSRRQAEHTIGQLTAPDTKRVTFADLAEFVRNDYRVRGRRSLDRLEISLAHLEDYFGACRALAITSDRITAYERERLDSGAARSPSTPNWRRFGVRLILRSRVGPAAVGQAVHIDA